MKYFCMVGSHDAGFLRLIRALDEFAGKHPENQILMQMGPTSYRPLHSEGYNFKPTIEMDIVNADIIVTHGSQCLFEALRLGKRLAVMPRLAKYGEVMNDHQVRFSLHMASRYGFPVLLEETNLEEVLLNLEKQKPPNYSPDPNAGLQKVIGTYLENLAKLESDTTSKS